MHARAHVARSWPNDPITHANTAEHELAAGHVRLRTCAELHISPAGGREVDDDVYTTVYGN